MTICIRWLNKAFSDDLRQRISHYYGIPMKMTVNGYTWADLSEEAIEDIKRTCVANGFLTIHERPKPVSWDIY